MKRCAYAYGTRTESVLWNASRPDPTRPDLYKYLRSPSILTLGSARGFAAMDGEQR